ncbi:transcriptional regulator [Afipia sp. Root123D2]|uniref:TetR/AcrR family transcriptional regulator n=1 Tax=Afipia sp. Root123D2 TaxID=1736436 RepID=UPI0006F3CD76|nr:TetR/AcrR family transcriptional regulator [Afipia sp. Root123D2]KQW23267.1 transcriptional regulator [Afipia sp. Root123D2]
MTDVRSELLTAGLTVFEREGFEGATVAAIREKAGVSNGSFFHVFGSKQELAGTLFLDVLGHYHTAMLASLKGIDHAAEGVAALVRAHLDWVVDHRREARFLFEISRSEWVEKVRGAQHERNAALADGIEQWRAPRVARGELLAVPLEVFVSQIIGPAQIFCRRWLSGRERSDPRMQTDALISCAIRALVAPASIRGGGGR